MVDIVEQIKKNIIKYNLIENNDRVVVGASGGPDSMCLLYSLNKLKQELNFEIIVAHVNHCIRQEAKNDENLVRKFCAENNIEIHILTADVLNEAKMLKISTEECGRNVRYEFFSKLTNDTGSQKIAIAHNLGDNAETIIMNMARGAGLDGLSGMEYISGNIIRPMLNIAKEDIIKFLHKEEISYAIDKTNFENNYTRNYIRNVLVPGYNKINPNFLDAMYRMSQILKNDSKILKSITNKLTLDLIISQGQNEIVIDTKKFKALDKEIQPRVVRNILSYILESMQGIDSVHIEDICELLNKSITGKKYIIGNKFLIEVLKNKKAKCVKTNTNIEL